MTEQAHGPEVNVIPQTAAKVYRKAAASALISLGMAVTALQAAMPYLHNVPWLPVWIAPFVASLGAGWTAWKQTADAQKLEPVNLSQPTAPVLRPGYGEDTPIAAPTTPAQPARRDLRLEIPASLDYGEVKALPATEPLPPVIGHGEIVAGQIIDEDLPKE